MIFLKNDLAVFLLPYYMITGKPQKTAKKYHCKKCDFTSRDKKDWKRHLSTTKHKNDNNGNKVDNNYICGRCEKIYKFKSGLSRHKKKCEKNFTAKNRSPSLEGGTTPTLSITKQLVEEMRKQREQNQELIDLCKERSVVNYQNCGNKKMTINVFLNEKCKDAMTLKDFVENLSVSLKDLEYTQEHGYVEGISNIFTKHLIDLKPTERPIHCCDKKRLKFYVKHEDKWEKDEENHKINKSIQDVTVKQIKKLKEWEGNHPTYLTDQKLLVEWHAMLGEIMGGGDMKSEKNKEQIKKKISEAIELKNAMLLDIKD